MPLEQISEERLEEVQQTLKERLTDIPAPLNVENAAALDAPLSFSFRGHAFVAERVDVPTGVKLQKCLLRIKDVDKYPASAPMADVFVEIMTQAAVLIGGLARPAALPRWIWRLMRKLHVYGNPFFKATDAEIGGLLTFFSLLRTRSSVRLF